MPEGESQHLKHSSVASGEQKSRPFPLLLFFFLALNFDGMVQKCTLSLWGILSAISLHFCSSANRQQGRESGLCGSTDAFFLPNHQTDDGDDDTLVIIISSLTRHAER